jgi:hypothetical protein
MYLDSTSLRTEFSSMMIGLSLDQIGKCLVLRFEEINQRLIQIVDNKYLD